MRVAACVAANCARCEGLPGVRSWSHRALARSKLGLECQQAGIACLRTGSCKPGRGFPLMMFYRRTSMASSVFWRSRSSGSIHAWHRQQIFGVLGGSGSEGSGAGVNQLMNPWPAERWRSMTPWPGRAALCGCGWVALRPALKRYILPVLPVASQLCSFAGCATSSCASIRLQPTVSCLPP